ncbi:hypothetical protein [Streptomyces sp. NPDC000994]
MRRIRSTLAERGSTGYNDCPDVFEPGDGSFFVIGKVPAAGQAPAAEQRRAMGASIGANERTVIPPRDCMLHAVKQRGSGSKSSGGRRGHTLQEGAYMQEEACVEA